MLRASTVEAMMTVFRSASRAGHASTGTIAAAPVNPVICPQYTFDTSLAAR